MTSYPRVAGWGKYLPSKVLTNKDLESRVDTSDEWIFSRTGIKERRIASDEETSSTMATEAARAALRCAGVTPDQVDLIIVATSTPERIFPACAAYVQEGLGAHHAAAFDVNAACTGFIYALASGWQFVAAGSYRNVLVIGSEVYSRILDWSDRATCILFGDGAGALLLQGADAPEGPSAFVLGNDGSGAGLLYVPGVCDRPAAATTSHYLRMNGSDVFRFAVSVTTEATRQVLDRVGLDVGDIDLLIPHQANQRIISAARRALGIPEEKVFVNVERLGNTSAASIPIALCEAAEQERLRPGDRLVLVGFGGGLSWGAMLFCWQPVARQLQAASVTDGQAEQLEGARWKGGKPR